MTWEEFKRRGVYKFELAQPLVAFREQIEQGKPFQTPSGKIEIFSTTLTKVSDWTETQWGYAIPAIPKWIEPFESLNHPLAKIYPFHMVTPHPRWRTHSIFHNIPWLRETYQQEITLNAADAKRLGIRTGDSVEVWNARGRIVLPAYVTERCIPGWWWCTWAPGWTETRRASTAPAMARTDGALGDWTFDTLAWSARTLGGFSPLRRALANRMEARLRARADHPAPALGATRPRSSRTRRPSASRSSRWPSARSPSAGSAGRRSGRC